MRATFWRGAARMLGIVIGGMFVYSGLAKIGEPTNFAESVASFRLLPASLVNLFALGLPPFEILLGSLLIVGWRRRTVSFCAVLIAGMFLVALVSAAVRGIPVDCGCFGTSARIAATRRSPWISIARDVLLFAVTIFLYAVASFGHCREAHSRVDAGRNG